MAWAGFGNTPQTKPTYLADRWLAYGYPGMKSDFVDPAFAPIGDTDATRPPPCNEVVGRVLIYPGHPNVTVGTASGNKVAYPLPGGGSVEIHYNC